LLQLLRPPWDHQALFPVLLVLLVLLLFLQVIAVLVLVVVILYRRRGEDRH